MHGVIMKIVSDVFLFPYHIILRLTVFMCVCPAKSETQETES